MKKNKKAIIFGTSGQAQVVAYLLNLDSEYEVVAFCCSAVYRESDYIFGKPLLDFEGIEKIYPPDKFEMYVSLSYTDNNKIRQRFYHEAKDLGYTLLTYISSKTTNFAESIGDNTFIFEDNTIQPFVSIGNNVILWSGNHIGHHSIIDDNCFISSHVVVSGHCKVGANSFIGVNSTLKDGILIGKFNILGAGCLMVKNTDDNKTYIGSKSTEYVKK
tara:strand:+ start:4069 stop:4716 length:648 start_codon:yes stop_codon:yes gene_type:complete